MAIVSSLFGRRRRPQILGVTRMSASRSVVEEAPHSLQVNPPEVLFFFSASSPPELGEGVAGGSCGLRA
jgi:hypothetical protein